MNIQLYGQEQEQVKVMRFLGMWMDDKLIFSVHIQRLISSIPHWLFTKPEIELFSHKDKKESNLPIKTAEQHVSQVYDNRIQIFTDSSKDAKSGRTAAAFIHKYDISISKRTRDLYSSVYNRTDSSLQSSSLYRRKAG